MNKKTKQDKETEKLGKEVMMLNCKLASQDKLITILVDLLKDAVFWRKDAH
jgi:hypothetical protein